MVTYERTAILQPTTNGTSTTSMGLTTEGRELPLAPRRSSSLSYSYVTILTLLLPVLRMRERPTKRYARTDISSSITISPVISFELSIRNIDFVEIYRDDVERGIG